MTFRRPIQLAAALIAFGAAAAPAAAQQEVGGGFSITGNVGVVSDYRFRGISLTGEDPAVQGTVNLNHSSGFYVGVWGSNLESTPLYGDVELDFYAGYTREIAPATNIDVGLLYYFYPGNDSAAGESDFFEPYASISHNLGPVTAKVGAAYAWDQDAATGGDDNVYLFAEATAAIPETPVSIIAHVGHSEGTLSPTGNYLNWRIGAEVALGRVILGAHYIDTDLPEGPNVGATAVATARITF